MVDSNQSCGDDNCLYDFCLLIDLLVKDIMYLEDEVVKTRYDLSTHLEYPYNICLQSDILSDLAARYSDNLKYKTYMKLLYANQDPMESDDRVVHLLMLAGGDIKIEPESLY